ncbi:MAG: sugar ABC transporter permease [Clostridia bacterium]|nr:sugar ABC transporter permease [Clostridia bacterium]
MTQKSKTRKMAQSRRAELIFYVTMIALPIMQFCIMYLGVNFNSVLLAFRKYDYQTGDYLWTGFTNFRTLFIDMKTSLRPAFLNSLKFYLCSLCMMPVSIIISNYLYKKKMGSGVFKVILFLPSIISGIVMTLTFQYFVEQVVPEVLGLVGVEIELGLLSNPDTAFSMLIVFSVWTGFGGGMLLYTGAMARIPIECVEAAQLDGITPLKELLYITLPLIYPTVSIFIITGIAGFFTNSGALYTFFGPRADASLWTYGYYFFTVTVNGAGAADYPYAAAGGLLFTLIAAPITLLVRWALEKYGPTTEY